MGKTSSDPSYKDDDHQQNDGHPDHTCDHKEDCDNDDDEEDRYFSDRAASEKSSQKYTQRCQGRCHSLFVMIKFFASVSNLSMLAAQVLPLFVSQLSVVDIVIRYIAHSIDYCIFLMFCETSTQSHST